MKNIFVLNVINSILGKRGNIGFRLNYVVEQQAKVGCESVTLARGNVTSKGRIYTMGLLGVVSRLVNYLAKAHFRFLNGRRIDLFLFNAFFLIQYFCRVRYSDGKFGVRIAHVCESSGFIVRFLKRRGYKIVLDVPIAPSAYVRRILAEGLTKQLKYNHYVCKQERACLVLADVVVVPSEFVAREIEVLDVARSKIRIIPFGCDLQAVPLPSSKESHAGKVKFVFAGNVSFRKGVDLLLEVWDSPCFAGDELHLCGKVFPEIRTLLNSKKLTNVYLPGFVDTYRYFQDSDVYVFPSLMEGSSKSIYEAMACSLPVIATFESGSVLQDGEDGFVIPAGDADSLKNAMLRFKNDRHLVVSMGRNARKNVQNYPWSRYAESAVGVYEQFALNGKPI